MKAAKIPEPPELETVTFPLEVKVDSVFVKIYRVENKGRTSFTVSFKTKGKRTLKMFAEFLGAWNFAHTTGQNISDGQIEGLQLTNAQVRIFWLANEKAVEAGVPLDVLASEYAEIVKILRNRATPLESARYFDRKNPAEVEGKSVSKAVEEMLDTKEREGASAQYRKMLKRFLREFAKKHPDTSMDVIATSQVADFLREMQVGSVEKKTLRPATARTKNNARATLGAFFKFCRERGWVGRDHDGIEFVPKFREKGGDIEILSAEEMALFLKHARKEMIPFLAIGGFAGLRTAEIQRLDWSEVHLKDRFIEVKAEKAKTASRRIVPISDNLAAWLKHHAKEAGRVVPFDNIAKQIGWLVADVNDAFAKEAEKAKKDPKDALKFAWKHNGLRHSFISYRVAEIQNANQVALEAGNSPAMIFKHYRELVRPADAKKWFAIMPKVKRGEVTKAPEPTNVVKMLDAIATREIKTAVQLQA